MDTFKDKQMLDDLYNTGKAPWEVWKEDGGKNEKGSSPAVVQGPVERVR